MVGPPVGTKQSNLVPTIGCKALLESQGETKKLHIVEICMTLQILVAKGMEPT